MDPAQAQNDALFAADFPGVPLQLLGGAGALLDGQQPADHRADEAHENIVGDRGAHGPGFALDAAVQKKT